MKRWGLRHRGYKIGFVGVAICTVFFIIAFVSPSWRNERGLWFDCTLVPCVSLSSTATGVPAWFDAARVFESMCLLTILLSIAMEVHMDFFHQPTPERRMVEIFALVAGMFGLVGCIIFATFTPVTHSPSYFHSVYLNWGYGMATTSSCFFLIFACLIAFYRRKGLDVFARQPPPHGHRQAEGLSMQGESRNAQEFNGLDVAPPAYSEVVRQPVMQPGGGGTPGNGPLSPRSYPDYKPPDLQPPPAYFPPPPGGQLHAPPPYSSQPEPPSSQSPGLADHGSVALLSPSNDHRNPDTGMENPGADLSPDEAAQSSPDHTQPESSASRPEPCTPGTPVITSVPAYFVTVMGQTVPVFREELQHEVPSAGAPVPSFFIVTHGQHVPVYTEEQAKALAGPSP